MGIDALMEPGYSLAPAVLTFPLGIHVMTFAPSAARCVGRRLPPARRRYMVRCGTVYPVRHFATQILAGPERRAARDS